MTACNVPGIKQPPVLNHREHFVLARAGGSDSRPQVDHRKRERYLRQGRRGHREVNSLPPLNPAPRKRRTAGGKTVRSATRTKARATEAERKVQTGGADCTPPACFAGHVS